MRLYKHEGSGRYIGSCIVVVADSLGDAEIHIKALLIKNGLSGEVLQVVEMDIYSGLKVVEINGDY